MAYFTAKLLSVHISHSKLLKCLNNIGDIRIRVFQHILVIFWGIFWCSTFCVCSVEVVSAVIVSFPSPLRDRSEPGGVINSGGELII